MQKVPWQQSYSRKESFGDIHWQRHETQTKDRLLRRGRSRGEWLPKCLAPSLFHVLYSFNTHLHILITSLSCGFSFFSCQPDVIPGDVIIVLQEQEHPRFKRNETDLLIEQEITLFEALCGFSFTLTHLDGRTLLVRSRPGEIIKPG